jgi:hypothetical protein
MIRFEYIAHKTDISKTIDSTLDTRTRQKSENLDSEHFDISPTQSDSVSVDHTKQNLQFARF